MMSSTFQGAYKEIVDGLMASCTQRSKKALTQIHKKFLLKGLTKEGKDRKRRIVERLFYQREKTDVYLTFYQETLPMFKSFVLVFQKSEPMVHTLHDELVELAETFLACFVKRKKVKSLKSSELKKLNLQDPENLRSVEEIYVGTRTQEYLSKMETKLAPMMDALASLPIALPGAETTGVTFPQQFRRQALEAYQAAGQMMLDKFPISNSLLRRLSALDPRALGNDNACKALQRLKGYFPTVLEKSDHGAYDAECSKINVTNDLPSVGDSFRLDHWWNEVIRKGQFPQLCKVVKAALSIFTGPKVESSFSAMNDIVDKKSNRLNVETYQAYQEVRYRLKAKKMTALQLYHREDKLHTPVNRSECFYLQTSYGRYSRKLQKRQEKKAERSAKELGITASTTAKPKQKKVSIHDVAKQVKRKIQKHASSKPPQKRQRKK